MHRIDHSTAAGALPAPDAAGVAGFFIKGDPQTAVPATVVTADWANATQEELAYVIEQAGLVLSKTDHTQLRQAIQTMIATAQKAIVISGATFAVGVANGNAVRWDAGAGNFAKAVADGTANNLAVGIADVTNSKVYCYGETPAYFAGLTPGARYYLDPAIAGAVTSAKPADVVIIGVAKSATTMYVDIDDLVSLSATVRGASKNLQASANGIGANIAVSADELVAENAGGIFAKLSGINVTINSAGAVGQPNSLSTGVLAASTWYAVYIWYNGTTVCGTIDPSFTAPTAPAGYAGGYYAIVWAVRTDGTANKYPLNSKKFNRKTQYIVQAGTNVTALPIIISGVQGSISTPIWVAASIIAVVPPNATDISLVVGQQTAAASTTMCAPNNAYGPYNSTTNPPPIVSGFAAGGGICNLLASILLEDVTKIYFASSGSSNFAAVLGWEDNQ